MTNVRRQRVDIVAGRRSRGDERRLMPQPALLDAAAVIALCIASVRTQDGRRKLQTYPGLACNTLRILTGSRKITNVGGKEAAIKICHSAR